MGGAEKDLGINLDSKESQIGTEVWVFEVFVTGC